MKTQSNVIAGQSLSSIIECASGQFKHYPCETLMQRINSTYNYASKEVSNRDSKNPPCLLLETGGKATTLDSFAYTWDTPENCVITKILKQDAKMLLCRLSMKQKENQFFFLSEFEQ